MPIDDNALKAHVESLNAWHLELAITASALKNLSLASEVDNLGEPLADLVYILQQKLDALVDSCPFPSDLPTPEIPLDLSVA
jgi:hypothetical protein